MSNDKTLATVKHGGCVQLGDGLPPLPIRQRFTTLHGETYAYSAEQMREYALAALSVQPSPGGQGDALNDLQRYSPDPENTEYGWMQGMGEDTAMGEWVHIEDVRALAARQPVGEPDPYIVGNQYFTQAGNLVRFVAVHNEGTSYECMEDEAGVNRYTRRDFGRVAGSAHDYSDPRNTPPLYAAPPAQAVDLGLLDDIASDLHQSALSDDYEPEQIVFLEAICKRLRALIYSQAVGK